MSTRGSTSLHSLKGGAASSIVAASPEDKGSSSYERRLPAEELGTTPAPAAEYAAIEIVEKSTSDGIVAKDDVEGGGEVVDDVGGRGPWLHIVIFIVMGTAELFVWNAVISILFNIREEIYTDYPSMTDSLNGINNVSNVLVAVYCVYTGAMNQSLVVIAGFTLGACCIGLAMLTQWATGLTGVILWHVINFIAGAACGMYQTGGFGLAAALPIPMTGYVSTGQGVSGVFTWVLWTIISEGAKMDVRPAMWVLMSIGFVSCSFSAFAYILLLRRPDVKSRVEKIQIALKEEAHNPDAPSYLFLFKRCWWHVLTIWYNFFITLFFFPNIGPLGWKAGDQTNYIIGMFQIGDLIGRYTPNVLKFLVFSPVVVACIVAARTVLLPFAIISYFKHENSFFGSTAFHYILMLILAITNGWMASNVYLNTPKVIKSENWKARVGSMVIVGLLLGIAAGLWAARIFTAVN